MASQWLYRRGDVENGPYTSKELHALAASGELQREDLLWKEGMAEWVPAGLIPELYPEFASTAPSVSHSQAFGTPPKETPTLNPKSSLFKPPEASLVETSEISRTSRAPGGRILSRNRLLVGLAAVIIVIVGLVILVAASFGIKAWYGRGASESAGVTINGIDSSFLMKARETSSYRRGLEDGRKKYKTGWKDVIERQESLSLESLRFLVEVQRGPNASPSTVQDIAFHLGIIDGLHGK
jgi:hypothetical protein